MSITNEQLATLRTNGTLAKDEIAYQEGDLIIAKNVVTEVKRIIGVASEVLLESNNRRVLKG